jgi:hypothetical protein
MTYQRLPYDDAATTAEMVSDATEVGRELHIAVQVYDDLAPDRAPEPAFGTVLVSDELADMAAGLELHFD